MINTVVAIIYCLGISVIGYSLLNLFIRKELSGLEKISISYGLGVGVIAFQLFIYSILGLQWNIYTVFIPWIFVFSHIVCLSNTT